MENRSIQQRVSADLAEMRVALRIKSEELERTTNLYEEMLTL